MSDRIVFALDPIEWSDFQGIRPFLGDAFAFWREVANRRQLDPKSIIWISGDKYSALPRGHRAHWCYPMPLRCKNILAGALQ